MKETISLKEIADLLDFCQMDKLDKDSRLLGEWELGYLEEAGIVKEIGEVFHNIEVFKGVIHKDMWDRTIYYMEKLQVKVEPWMILENWVALGFFCTEEFCDVPYEISELYEVIL